ADERSEGSHVSASGVDVTARRAAEVELREAQERFQKAFDNASIGMCLLSVEGRFIQVNAAFCTMLGYPDDKLTGRSIADVTHPDDLSGNVAALDRMLAWRVAAFRAENWIRPGSGRT